MSRVTAHLTGKSLPDDLRVYSFHGVERISQLSEYELLVAVPGGLDPEALLGSRATLSLDIEGLAAPDEHGRPGRVTRLVHGLIAECIDEWDADGSEDLYRLRLVPRLWRANLVQTVDIYMDLTVPEIVALKLGRIALQPDGDFELRLSRSYPKREFVVQYQETDLAFLSRLCEHHGIAFFFEHCDGRDVVVFSDANSAFPAVMGGGATTVDDRADARTVRRLRAASRLVPRRFIQNDYNYRTPHMGLSGMAQIEGGYAGAVVEYGGHFKTAEEGTELASVRAEERAAASHQLEGQGNDARLTAGRQLHVTGHRRGDLDLVLVEVEHRGRQGFEAGAGAEYENDFRAVPLSYAYRPPRLTPVPRVGGLLTGVVEAKEGSEYADVDDQGRYRVRFLFDTTFDGERQASRPVRMMQPHAGPGYGMHFPLRGGVEVLIAFVGGDPDRPIIAGTVPNPRTASPVSSANNTRNVIRTGGGNEINIDDTKEGQRIKLSTPTASTVFQLGSPNAPERGAMLATQGASSTIASGGLTQLGTFAAMGSAVTSLFTSGNIVSVAGDSSPMESLWGLGTGIVGGLNDTVLQSFEFGKSIMDAEIEAAKLRALDADNAVRGGQDTCKKCREEAVKTATGTPTETPVRDWSAKASAAEEKYSAYMAAMEGAAGTDSADKHSADAAAKEVDEAKSAYEAAEKESTEARAALPTPAPCPECDTLAGLRAAAIAAKNAVSEIDDRQTPHRQNIEQGELVMGYVGQAASVGGALLSVTSAAITFFTRNGAAASLIDRWKATKGLVADIKGKLQTSADLTSAATEVAKTKRAGLFPVKLPGLPALRPGEARLHSVGSDHQMEVFGKEGVVTWGKTAAVVGMGTTEPTLGKLQGLVSGFSGMFGGSATPNTTEGEALLVGGKNAYVLAGEEVEVGARKKVTLAAKDVVVKGIEGTATDQGTVTVEATTALKLTSKETTLTAEAKKAVVLESNEDTLTAKASKAVTVESSTDALTLKSKKDVAVTSESNDVKVTATSGKIALKASAGNVDAEGKSVVLTGTTSVVAKGGSQSQLRLSATSASLKAPSASLSLAASGSTLAGSRILLDAKARVVIDGPLVSVNGKLVQLG